MSDTCANCLFARKRTGHAIYTMECHRFPPTSGDDALRWGAVRPDDWCGEHKERYK